MIQEIVRNYLDEALAVPVFMEVPKNAPSKFVTVRKTGGGVDDHIYRATITLQSYAPTLHKAAELNEEVKAAMDGIIVLDTVTKSKLNSDYDFTDTATKKYRWQAVYDLHHY